LSPLDFTVEGPRTIRFGLAAIKNVGEAAIEGILRSREQAGRFTSLPALCADLDPRLVNKRVLESLIKAGALDSLGVERSRLVAGLDRALESAQSAARDRVVGQESLFGGSDLEIAPAASVLPDVPPWGERERLGYERETLGFYITGHPLAEHAALLRAATNADTSTLGSPGLPEEVSLGGIVTAVRPTRTKKGTTMAYVTLEDLHGTVEVIVFPDLYQKAIALLEGGRVLVVSGKPEEGETSTRFLATDLVPIEEARLRAAREMVVRVTLPLKRPGLLEELHEAFVRNRGPLPVRLEVVAPGSFRVLLAPHAVYRLAASPRAVGEIEALLGEGAVRVGGRGF
jgi:DNA polymerase-3 subunit alpha